MSTTLPALMHQWLVAPVLVYLHAIFESRELCFWSKIDVGRRTTNIGESRHRCSNIKIEDECSFLPHLLPDLSRETRRRIESEVQSFLRGQELGIMNRIVVYGKDWRRARSGSWWTEPLNFFGRHEVGIVTSLHTLRSHRVGKLSLQNTGVRRSTIGNEKLGVRNQL